MTGHKEKILELIKGSSQKLTLKDVATVLSAENLSFKYIKQEVRELLEQGRVEYLHEHGNSFLIPSFNSFVKISDKIVVHPPHLRPSEENDSYYVKIENSTSFGRGNHPTTRLCLKAMEKAVERKDLKKDSFFDLGCGTGILAIAAAFFGFDSCFAVDIDPVAVFDAKRNVSINGLDSRIEVNSIWPENRKFCLAAANLRPVSLADFKTDLKNMLDMDSNLVISGFKNDEKNWLLNDFEDLFSVENIWEEKGWCSALLRCRI